MKLWPLAVVSIITVCSFVLSFLYYNNDEPTNPTANVPTQAGDAQPVKRIAPAGQAVYESPLYGFSLLYPNTLVVREVYLPGGASNIIFENVAQGVGFQIFVVPYNGEQVSEERFLKDIPSGVRTNAEEVVIDGAKGSAFYSKNELLGETREVWFIHGGFLFEVMTLKLLEAHLLEILSSWEFT